MKYISLIGALKLYGTYVDNLRTMHQLRYELMSRGFNAQQDYKVFWIETGEPDTNGQVMKTLRFSGDVNVYSIMGATQPARVVMPPILEIEWLTALLDMSGNYKGILEYLSYMFIMQFISWNTVIDTGDSECYNKILENGGAIIDVGSLAMTPALLSAIELPYVKLPKIKNWHTFYAYGTDFSEIFRLCMNQSQSTKELYHHMPVLLALFMVACKTTKLKGWPKSERIQMENSLQDVIRAFGTHTVAAPVPVTYGGCVSLTGQDMAFMRYVLDIIRKEIHEMNNNIGLINIYEYRNIRGPEKIKASVRLSGMSINWKKELKKAEEEKEAREKEAEGKFDEEGE